MSEEIALSPADRAQGLVRCDACPVLCRIRPGRVGACDRYANEDGKLVRVDPLVLLAKPGVETVAFVTGIGATTTYPDYKPAPFIVSSKHDGVDMVTVVTEGIFSYCGVKVKIDTDRYLGPEQALVRVKGEQVATSPRRSMARRCCRWWRASSDRRQQERGRRHLRGAAGAL